MKISREGIQEIIGYVVVIGVIIVLTCGILFFQEKGKQNKGRYAELIEGNVLYDVTKVLDGDTLIANVSGKEVTVRLIGIDTPEVVDPRKPVQCFGPEASAKAKEVFNRVYTFFYDNQELTKHPKTNKLPANQWKTISWNAAWIAADACDNTIPTEIVIV